MNLQNQLCELPTLLTGVNLPAPLDSEYMKSVIMFKAGLLIPLYSEPETMQECISVWFYTHYWNFERLVKLIQTEYAPLENYDRHETGTRGISGNSNSTGNGNATETIDRNSTGLTTDHLSEVTERTENLRRDIDDRKTSSGEIENSETESSTVTVDHDETVTAEISADNASTYQPDNQKTTAADTTTETERELSSEGSSESRETDVIAQTDAVTEHIEHTADREIHTNTHDVGQKTTVTQQTNVAENTQNEEHSGYMHGNIGVTTSQQMFLQELDLLRGFNAYDYICDMFIRDNMLHMW